MPYVMGIDGGGSAVRVAVLAADLTICGQSTGPTTNPSVVGRDAARRTIQAAMREALGASALLPGQIAAVGIGVAGAAMTHAEDWLRAVVAEVTPQARVVPSADYEIALVGAHGERRGVLVLAGTGSLAYGVNAAGESALVGGWGYLLGDEGGGFWIGLEGLRAAVRGVEGRGPATALSGLLLEALRLGAPRELIGWLYHGEAARTREIAALAPLVFAQAEAGDSVAVQIVNRAADELAAAARAVTRQLGMDRPRIAFAGGLLSAETPLRRALCAALELPTVPEPRHPPVVGAALLALAALGADAWEEG